MKPAQKKLFNQRLNHTVARVNAEKAARFLSNCIDRWPCTWAREAFDASPGIYTRQIIVDIWRGQLKGLREANVARKLARKVTFPLYHWQREAEKKGKADGR